MLGRVLPAVSYLEEAYRKDPANPDVNFWLGLAYLEAAEFEKAILRLQEARNSKPKDIDLLFLSGASPCQRGGAASG